MQIELLVGLNVVDDDMYQAYRNAMGPILEKHRGGFGVDFVVSKVLKSTTDAPMNRVFTIFFGDETLMDSFFSNPEYLEIRKKFYEPSVNATTIIAKYEREI